MKRKPARERGSRKRAVMLLIALAAAANPALANPQTRDASAAVPGLAKLPVPADNPLTPAKIALGRRLFYDADLSRDGSMACATCHEQRRAFTDGNATHPGVLDDPGIRNIPSLDDVAWMPSLTWGDPRVKSLEAQAAIPILGTAPVEMGMAGRQAELSRRLASDGCTARMFRAAFPQTQGRIGMDSIARALAAFERTIVSFDTAWDQARAGGAALNATQAAGEALFLGPAHCAACHSGPIFSDGQFHAIAAHRGATKPDQGLAAITLRAGDAGAFRTPGLRNAAITAPYLHDGSAPSLEAAIARHDRHLTGVPALTAVQVGSIVKFLGSLTDTGLIRDTRLSLPPPGCPL